MTVIVAANYTYETVIIADSRVSWTGGQIPPRDILRKLYIIGLPNKQMVLGVTGRLDVIAPVMEHLRSNIFLSLRRRLVVPEFKDSLRNWIEEATVKLPMAIRSQAKFMLSACESTYLPKSGQITGITGGFGASPGAYIYTYSISAMGTVTVSENLGYAVLGSGSNQKDEVFKIVQQIRDFGFNQPNLWWGRAFILGRQLSELFSQNEKETVGGPFQIIRITGSQAFESYAWANTKHSTTIQAQRSVDSTVIIDPDTNLKCTVVPIWLYKSLDKNASASDRRHREH